MQSSTTNPFLTARRERITVAPRSVPEQRERPTQPLYVKLPRVPVNTSPVPHLTSLYHNAEAGDYGDRGYAGNCSGNLIKDLIRYFGAKLILDPMTGSGTCRDVCDELGVYCWSSDLHQGVDACDASRLPPACFDFCWLHPPYWRQKLYTEDARCLSRTPTLDAFLDRYKLLIEASISALAPGGKLAILMGDYCDREAGFVSLVYHTKRLAFAAGLRQHCTDIVRFSHGASSSKKVYRSSFIPGLHDVCMIFEKTV